MHIKTRRVRWVVGGEVVEQDAFRCTPEEWERLRTRPSFASWGAFRFGDAVVAVSFPVGVIVGQVESGLHV